MTAGADDQDAVDELIGDQSLRPATDSLALPWATGQLRRKEVFRVSPSAAEVETKKAMFRRLGAKELRRRLDDDQIGPFGSWERRVAENVLSDIAAEEKARRPTANGKATALAVSLVAALALLLKILGII